MPVYSEAQLIELFLMHRIVRIERCAVVLDQGIHVHPRALLVVGGDGYVLTGHMAFFVYGVNGHLARIHTRSLTRYRIDLKNGGVRRAPRYITRETTGGIGGISSNRDGILAGNGHFDDAVRLGSGAVLVVALAFDGHRDSTRAHEIVGAVRKVVVGALRKYLAGIGISYRRGPLMLLAVVNIVRRIIRFELLLAYRWDNDSDLALEIVDPAAVGLDYDRVLTRLLEFIGIVVVLAGFFARNPHAIAIVLERVERAARRIGKIDLLTRCRVDNGGDPEMVLPFSNGVRLNHGERALIHRNGELGCTAANRMPIAIGVNISAVNRCVFARTIKDPVIGSRQS